MTKTIVNEVEKCKKCDLWCQRNKPVAGSGALSADVVFIGEAPGRNEDLQGLPFVGSAGKILDTLLLQIGTSRNEVYITNIVKCRPPKNQAPKTKEIEACGSYLDKQIQIIKPKIIVTLGRHSTKYVLSKVGLKVTNISAVRGKVHHVHMFGRNFTIIPMYHPAASLYNPKYKDSIQKDFQTLKHELVKLKI